MENKEKNSVEEQGMVSSFFATLMINYNKCTHCGECVKVCDPGVLVMVNNELDVVNDAMQCNKCAKCLKRCPTRAISLNQSVR